MDKNPAKPRRRILVVAPFAPRFDATHGGRVIAQLIRELAIANEVALIWCRSPGAPEMDPELQRSCALVREVVLDPRGLIGEAWRHRLRVLTVPLTGRPSQVAFMYSRALAQTVGEIAVAWRADVVQIEHDTLAYCLGAAARGGAATVLVCHDPGVGVARGQAELTAGRQRFAHQLDERAWARFWRRTLPHADAVVAFTQEDAALLHETLPARAVEVIGLGIEAPEHPASAVGAQPPSVAYIGHYRHPPNADAAARLIGEIMPRVRRAHPGLPLMLVGSEPTDEMRATAGPDDHVTGEVPSVQPYLESASLLALPIRLGGGMRVKLLEALAAGKAIVASPLAAAGLKVRSGRELVLADDDDAFAAAIVALLSDERERARLGGAARAWALENLVWSARVREYEKLYDRLRADSRR